MAIWFSRRQWAWVLVAAVGVGVFMGIRDEFHSIWLRAGAAGCGFAILGLALTQIQAARRH
jgi:hypothetical protein